MTTAADSATPGTRRFDLDWLRVLGTMVVFLFHVTRYFDTASWHVKNTTLYGPLDWVIAVLAQWLMPLFFVISGASIAMALRPGRVGAFVISRLSRLGLPALLGMFVIAPPQVYIERVTVDLYQRSFAAFYLHDYFRGLYGRGGNFALTGMHLWYLFWLLLYTLALLPLVLGLRTRLGKRLIGALAKAFAHPGAILLLGVVVPIAHIFGEATETLWMEAGWNLLTYVVLLLLGYILIAEARFEAALRRGWPLALASALLLTVAMGLVWDFGENISDGQYVLQWGIRGIGAWCWIVAMWGAALRYLSFSNPFLRYTNELVLPYYILHQTVIIIVGFAIRHWPLSILLKFPLLAAVSFAIIMGLYEFAIRRNNILRFFFGLRSRSRATQPNSA